MTLYCYILNLFKKVFTHHSSIYMSMIEEYVDVEIFQEVLILNILGFKTVFSCQDLQGDGNSFQFVIKKSSCELFDDFLKYNSIIVRERYMLYNDNVSYEFTKDNMNNLSVCLIKYVNKLSKLGD